VLSLFPYVGRFAPSPTGPLHLGSLLTALASFLDARSCGGRWLIRIDDLDTPRVVEGAERLILDTLASYGLVHDEPIVRQSTRSEAYGKAVWSLIAENRAFHCGCTRREAQTGPVGDEGPIYPGTCREGLGPGRTARSVRSRVTPDPVVFMDRVQGLFEQYLVRAIGDFVIRRADGIAAYQLATVVDDAFQGVTDIVRGADLLSSTPRQLRLYQDLGLAVPRSYAHIPILVDTYGEKLGKSTGALALTADDRHGDLVCCLTWLGQVPPASLARASVGEIIAWGVAHWDPARIPRVSTLSVD